MYPFVILVQFLKQTKSMDYQLRGGWREVVRFIPCGRSQSKLTSSILISIYLIISHCGTGPKLCNIHILLMKTSIGLK